MKILHLEDNKTDAELTADLLLNEWPECEIQLVDNRSAYLAQLEKPCDLILSDFSLVNFNGVEALQHARERAPDVPFVFLSGTIGEDRALEALRSGARDYLLKDRPGRLISALHRALNDTRLERERRAAAEQSARVQRLQGLGMMAAGVAHDFNNVLAPVLMGASLVRSNVTDHDSLRILDMMETSLRRGVGLVKQIIDFSKGVSGEMQVLQVKHLFRELFEMMRQSFPSEIRVEDAVPNDLWEIKANPTQIHQVLLNLCVNARDAMPHGGKLRVRAGNVTLDGSHAAARSARPGRFVEIEITDNGTGIAPDILQRIWEPFFTTKNPGRGTGLGLSTTLKIVEDHNGFLSVTTKLGMGTTFLILLPVGEPEASDSASRPAFAADTNGTTENGRASPPSAGGRPIAD